MFFFDNLFTDQTLLLFLPENDYNGTATILANHLSKTLWFTEKKEKIKEELLNIFRTKIMVYIIIKMVR